MWDLQWKDFGYNDHNYYPVLQFLLQSCGENNELYISDYYFCLNDFQKLHFFYNPRMYWESIALEHVPKEVMQILRMNNAVLTRVNLEEVWGLAGRNYATVKGFEVETPPMGNHYCFHGSHFLTLDHSLRRFVNDMGEVSYYQKDIKLFDLGDLSYALGMSVRTNTPNHIKSILDLSCFTGKPPRVFRNEYEFSRHRFASATSPLRKYVETIVIEKPKPSP
jgi:hypothetical protein